MNKKRNKGWFSKSNPAKRTKEQYIKIGLANSRHRKGKPLSDEHKRNIKLAMQGKNQGELNPAWKGELTGYGGIHNWIRRHFGTPKKCEHCGMSDKHKMYHWANKSGTYKRDKNDWFRLCVSCHKEYDA